MRSTDRASQVPQVRLLLLCSLQSLGVLPFRVTVYYFIIHKGLIGRYFEAMQILCPSSRFSHHLRTEGWGAWVAQLVERRPSAHVSSCWLVIMSLPQGWSVSSSPTSSFLLSAKTEPTSDPLSPFLSAPPHPPLSQK